MAARAEIESLLRARKLDVTLTSAVPWTRGARDVAPIGIAALDDMLGGGLPRGHLSEVVGPRSSGRTSILCRALASAAARGEAVALIDTCDRFDPASAEASGLDLSKLLWVRDTGDAARALKGMNLILQAGGFGVVAFDLADVPAPDVRRFPHTTWMRIGRVIEGSQTVAVLVGAERIARSPGGVTIALDQSQPEWTGAADRARLLRALALRPRVVGGKI
jgi:recombination protein RecA